MDAFLFSDLQTRDKFYRVMKKEVQEQEVLLLLLHFLSLSIFSLSDSVR